MYVASDQQTRHHALVEASMQIYYSKQSALIEKNCKKVAFVQTRRDHVQALPLPLHIVNYLLNPCYVAEMDAK